MYGLKFNNNFIVVVNFYKKSKIKLNNDLA